MCKHDFGFNDESLVILPRSYAEFTRSYTEYISHSVKLRVNSVYLCGKKIHDYPFNASTTGSFDMRQAGKTPDISPNTTLSTKAIIATFQFIVRSA